ncbi:hypothetical protein JS530_07195 [Bifidobacterium sp. LC6]|uniref:SWIM-type domain-containing protein n=1 Tax=Bifidobacterium colobi TaxID=2809026 RepID=A0ABS5UVY1_9BIFI|nr:hypothetical protein [Bifidobacterium colobi]MBT1175284.1 hypothetical protein [Bifidobacterium colobi]
MSAPEKPMLATFETMFENTPLILERASDYWESGRVGDIQEIAPHLFHTQISGSSDDAYDVDIRLNHTDAKDTSNPIRIQSAACTCPYERTPYCKHIGAMLYELRQRLMPSSTTQRRDNGNHDSSSESSSITLPHTVLHRIQEELAARPEQLDGTLLFLWSPHLQTVARTFTSDTDDEQPLISPVEVQHLFLDSIDQYYGRLPHHQEPAVNDSGNAADCRELIETVQAVAMNAFQSTDYEHACINLRLCVHAVCTYLHTIEADLAPLFALLDGLVMRIRCYMENVAAFADPATAGKALTCIVEAAHDVDLRHGDPLNSMLLVSSALSFARYDGTRLWAYDVVEHEMSRNLEEGDETSSADSASRQTDAHTDGDIANAAANDALDDAELHDEIIRTFTQIIAYDLYTLSHDDDGRNRLLNDNPDSSTLMIMRAVSLIQDGHFQAALMTAQRFLDMSSNEQEADLEANHNGVLHGLLPHGWHTLMEACAEGLNDVTMLASIYRYYIVSCNDQSDARYVSVLRNLLRMYGGLSLEEWGQVARNLARDCARNILDRIKYQPEMTTFGGTQRHSSWRNPAYEKLIIDERLSDAALTYCSTITYPPLPLLRTIAIDHPDSAKTIILNAMPRGTMGPAVFKYSAASPSGDALPARRSTYQQIAKQLRRYSSVFGPEETRTLAHDIVSRYPNRTALREELAFAL